MLKGFAQLNDGSTKTFQAMDEAVQVWEASPNVLWLDIESPSEDVLSEIADVFALDKAAVEDCVHGEQRPRIDEYDDYAFLLFYGAIGAEFEPVFRPRKMGAFLGKRLLVTVHDEPLRSIRTMLAKCDRRASQHLSAGVDTLLFRIIDMMVDNYVKMADAYEESLEDLEDRSLASDVDQSILEDVMLHRRALLELRRVSTSQRELLLPMATGEFDAISESLGSRFSHVHDHLTKVIELVDTQRERLAGVRENYHSTLASRTNDVMRVLTVFAAVLLPLSVVAGIYGMNVAIWPSVDTPGGFIGVLAVMVAMGGIMIAFFKRKKWL